MPNSTKLTGKFVARHAEARIRTALTDTRIVAIVGPRQSGKTTLARRIAGSDGRPYISLDDEQFRDFAKADPAAFLRGQRTAVIDEIQRAPGLILALKQSVDEDPRPGRYLITGSVDLFRSSISPDSLAGRVETIELLPFSRAELTGSGASKFLDRAFAADFPGLAVTGATPDLIEHAVSGGYPEALSRAVPARRRDWLLAYARSLTERDVSEIATLGKRDEMGRLIDHAAASAGRLLNLSRLGSYLGVDGKTVDRWLVLLEHHVPDPTCPRLASKRAEEAGQDSEAALPRLRPARSAAPRRCGGHRKGQEEARAAPRMPRPFRARQGRLPVGRGGDYQPLSRQGPGRSRSCPRAPFRRSRRDRSQGECDGTAPETSGDWRACRALPGMPSRVESSSTTAIASSKSPPPSSRCRSRCSGGPANRADRGPVVSLDGRDGSVVPARRRHRPAADADRPPLRRDRCARMGLDQGQAHPPSRLEVRAAHGLACRVPPAPLSTRSRATAPIVRISFPPVRRRGPSTTSPSNCRSGGEGRHDHCRGDAGRRRGSAGRR